MSNGTVATAFCVLLGFTAQAHAIDDSVTIGAIDDVTARRQALIQDSFGLPVLPTTQSSVTTIANPLPGLTNVARVDQYLATESGNQTNVSNLYVAGPIANGRMVALNPGHQGTCDWSQFYPGYNVQPLLQGLLSAGYSVLALNIPACGYTDQHVALFTAFGDQGMHYFHEPMIQAINYMVGHQMFSDYNIVGLSGGGWTATTVAAIDPRIHISVEVAGSMPGVQFIPGAGAAPDHGDCAAPCFAEQNAPDYYTIAGYLDQYIMASVGQTPAGLKRHHIQILNYSDSCCFGVAQWDWYQNYYGMDWPTYVAGYATLIQANVLSLQPGEFTQMIDTSATQHQFSPNTIAYIISTLDAAQPSTPPPPAPPPPAPNCPAS